MSVNKPPPKMNIAYEMPTMVIKATEGALG
jgi:hypothetical protein